MKATELLEIKLKKYSVKQLIEKLEKGSKDEEKSIIISILEKRGQDVSAFVEKIEEVVPVREDLAKEVDSFVDTLIVEHRDGVYEQVMKALGGNFDSDLDELLDQATEAQLKEALSFKNIKAKKEEPTQPKVQKKVEGKTEKTVEPKKKDEKLLKSKTIEKFSDSDDFSCGSKVSFEVNDKSKTGTISRIFIYHKTNKEQCRIKGDDKKVYFKTVKSIKLTK